MNEPVYLYRLSFFKEESKKDKKNINRFEFKNCYFYLKNRHFISFSEKIYIYTFIYIFENKNIYVIVTYHENRDVA